MGKEFENRITDLRTNAKSRLLSRISNSNEPSNSKAPERPEMCGHFGKMMGITKSRI